MARCIIPLRERLAEIGGQLQKLRWEALDAGEGRLVQDIGHAIEAVAWAAGVYSYDANIAAPPNHQAGTASKDEEIPLALSKSALKGGR